MQIVELVLMPNNVESSKIINEVSRHIGGKAPVGILLASCSYFMGDADYIFQWIIAVVVSQSLSSCSSDIGNVIRRTNSLNSIDDMLSGDEVWNGHDVFMEFEARFGCFEAAE
jgi:hypothetical protein